jgi:hypothetical protein
MTPQPDAALMNSIRTAVFADLASVPAFAAAVEKSERTIGRLISQGLPIVRVGATPYVVVSKAAQFIMATAPDRNVRPRGRPVKRAA